MPKTIASIAHDFAVGNYVFYKSHANILEGYGVVTDVLKVNDDNWMIGVQDHLGKRWRSDSRLLTRITKEEYETAQVMYA